MYHSTGGLRIGNNNMCAIPSRDSVSVRVFGRLALFALFCRAFICRTTVSSMSDETALFSLAGPGAVEGLAELQSVACPPAGRSVEWNFEGAKVCLNCIPGRR